MRWIALLLLAACASNPVSLDRELDAIASDPARPLKSIAALAIRDGKVVYVHDGDTLYRIASISKMVTTLGVLRLVEDGKLALDVDIGTYLGYAVRNPSFPDTPITLRMLLTHTSSLRDDAGYADVDVPATLRNPAAWSSKAKPGAHFQYANLPWRVVGAVMERATGERFDRLLKQIVLEPLGMRGGFNAAELSHDEHAHLATLYRKATAGDVQVWDPSGPWVPQVDDYSRTPPVSSYGPQGSLRTSVTSLGRMMLMLMNGGEIEGRRFLKRQTIDEMLSPQWMRTSGSGDADYGTHRGRFNAWGLGNQVFMDVSGPDFGDRLVEGGFRGNGHLGDAYGLLGTLAFDPRTKDGFVFLVGGTGFDPDSDRGIYSAGARFEERIATAIDRFIRRRSPGS